MHLKELRINGFKSFADPTRLHFDPGVTAVVGPNGCGKSNIADAIRWVLGEQSAKALRGGRMQDVIFEGTDQRKPLQFCEVALVFTDCESVLSLGFNEVEIARRASRDATGEYLLNGKPCRLRDIQQLFMDTGIGRTSYSIMAQGQIDQILSTNPVERRAIFEEAAGITKYKTQRREALNKLQLVEVNLNRLTDVIEEVKRQINSLRRQASKALRYKRLRFRLEHLDLAHGAWRFSLLRDRIEAGETRARDLKRELEDLRSSLSRGEREIEGQKAARGQSNQRLQEAQQPVFDLRSRKEQAGNAMRLANARRQDLAARLQEAEKELLSLGSQLGDLSKRAEGNAQIKEEQAHLVESSGEMFRLRNQEMLSLQDRLVQSEEALARERNGLLRYENEAAGLRNRASAIEVGLRSDEMRQASLKEEIGETGGDAHAAGENLALLQNNRESVEKEIMAAEAALNAAREEVASRLERFRQTQSRIQDEDRLLAQNTARLRLLQQLQEKLEGFSDGAKAVLQGKLDPGLNGAERCPLTTGAHVPAAHTKAVETLLGSAMDAVAVRDPSTALTILEMLEQQKLGKACIQFPVAPNGTAACPDFLKPAPSLIQCEEEEGRPHPLRSLLEGSYLVEDAADFLRYWSENPGFSFQQVATPKGDLIDRRGLIYGGYGKSRAAGILRRSNEIQELSADIAEQGKLLKTLRAEAEAGNVSLQEAEQTVETSRTALMAIAEKRSSLQAEERALGKTAEDLTNRLRRLERERDESLQRQEKARADLASLREQVDRAQSLLEEQKGKITAAERAVHELREERESKRETLAQARLDLAEKRQRLEILDRGLLELEQRRGELRNWQDSKRSEIDSLREQITALVREAGQREEEETRAAAELAARQNGVEEARAAFAALENTIAEMEKELLGIREQTDRVQSELNKLEVELATQRSKTGFLREEAEREYQVDLAGVDWRESLWRADDDPGGKHPLDLEEEDAASRKPKSPRGPLTDEAREEMRDTDWEAVGAEIQALRARIQSMGPVNLVAIEEYSELKDRFAFLTEQSGDLVRSRQELIAAIDDINQRSQARFQEIFEQIQKNFSHTFQVLFGGGFAALHLLESEDVLECGVEIVAQPPGTRLKNLALLSGGQKAMTAVALLFSIYMVKPSPFCVLDELDAPLDEANIGRFTDMLKQFTSQSQFIIITHNKRTIREAQIIFGVTMEEKGVSKVISMKFNRGDENRPEAGAEAPAEAALA